MRQAIKVRGLPHSVLVTRNCGEPHAHSRMVTVTPNLSMDVSITMKGLSRILACLIALWGCGSQGVAQSVSQVSDLPAPLFGGDHEFGAIVGFSPHGGPVWGYDQNVHYLPVMLRYSYLALQKRSWSLRYSPEVTALSVMCERAPSPTNPAAPVCHFGSGISPVGFQVNARPFSKTQPFFSTNAGFIYYGDRVLSPQGSQWMYTIDFGAGVNIFVSRRNAITVGLRYQHLSNANISLHNPGTDPQTIYVGYSRFHTHGVR